jgi:hypothetical protein
VFESKQDANRARRKLIIDDEYDKEEVFVVTHKLVQKLEK